MMTSRAVLAIGLGQLVNWGVLYYAFGVLMIPWSAIWAWRAGSSREHSPWRS